MTPYEDIKTADILSRRPNGATVAALVLGGVSAAAAIGAWIFAPIFAKSEARANKTAIDILASSQVEDRAYVRSNQPTMLDYINVNVNPLAFSNATSRAAAFNMGGYYGGGATNPLPVALYQPAMPCSCNTCGCNG